MCRNPIGVANAQWERFCDRDETENEVKKEDSKKKVTEQKHPVHVVTLAMQKK